MIVSTSDAASAVSGLALSVPSEAVPMQMFAKYAFSALLPYDRDLAFKVGLRAMRLPILEAPAQQQNGGDAGAAFAFPRWFTLGHIEAQQGALAAAMMEAARGQFIRTNHEWIKLRIRMR